MLKYTINVKRVIAIPPKTTEQKESQKRYIAGMSRVEITMKPEKRKRLQEHAEERGESVNAFINRAIDETMEQDGEKE